MHHSYKCSSSSVHLFSSPALPPLMAAYAIFLWLLAITLASVLRYLMLRRTEAKGKRPLLPPSPEKLPIIGNLHQLGKLQHQSLWKLSQKHGPLIHLKLGNIPTLVVSSAEMAREVMRTHDLDFCSRPSLVATDNYTYNRLDIGFAPYGEYWREMRKICILELFSVKRLQSFSQPRDEEIDLMLQTIARSSSNPTNLSQVVLALTNNIICRIALGRKYQKGVHGTDELQRIMEEMRATLGVFFYADYFPWLGWIDRLTGTHGRLEKNKREFDAFFELVIEDHLNPNRQKPEHEDIVDVLLELKKDNTDLTKENIKAVLSDMFVAGTETSATVLIWAMSELIRNPRLMRKAQEEVRLCVGIKTRVKESEVHQLHYLKAIVKETMRLHSPVPMLLPRESLRRTTIDGYDILPNTRVLVNAWGIGRDPKSWKDPEEFIPERFLGSSIDFKGHDFELIPFGSGRRICPALNFGSLTIELVLANLLYMFDWKLPDGVSTEDVNMDETPGITVFKKSPLLLVAINHKN